MRLETFTQNMPDHHLAEVKITTRRKRTRVGMVFGIPPGSHLGFWRTRNGFSGRLNGWNLRVGRRFRTCLTLFVLTYRET